MDLDKYIIPFGKYKGEYLGDVVCDDKQYMEWVAQNIDGELGEKANEILDL